MSSLKEFLSDQETSVDLLNNEAIASTIVGLLRERPGRPVTVGVHGDWGAGKSSILEMIEASLVGDPSVLCLKFNGWRFQGFEDAKIALIEGIVTGLLEKRPALTKATAQVKEVLKRVDWLKVAKKSGGLAMMALTGLPSPDLVQGAASLALGALQNPAAATEEVGKAIEGLQGLLKGEGVSSNVPEEIDEFRKAFDALLSEARVDQLIVLIDDLDRCLPDTAIETLEAVRLFVFTPRTAFVVAADEAMIEYSVRKHFPDLPSSAGPQTYARNYLEKLIQIPFRIPPLGESETRIYIALALAEAELGQESKEFGNLQEYARGVLRRPWLRNALEDAKVREALGAENVKAAELVAASDAIAPVLARGTSGNPRQIKRFLNALLLRERIAEARGFGEDVAMPVLAKLMLAERFQPKFFDEIIVEAASDPNGRSALLKALEGSEGPTPETGETREKEKTGTKSQKEVPPKPQKEESPWAQHAWVVAWLEIPPTLAAVDLRPYAFIANQQARMAQGAALGHLMQLVNRLMGNRLAVAGMRDELKRLSPVDAAAVLQELERRVRAADMKVEPAGADGFRELVKQHPSLRPEALAFLRFLPPEDLGLWVTTGWAQVFEGQEVRELLEGWAGQTANRALANAARAVMERPA